jgi:acetyl esterase/lipase
VDPRLRGGRLYVRDDQPFGGAAAPAAMFFYSPDRGGAHPERHLAGYAGILQADAYAGFNTVYKPERKPGPIIEAACWAHARRKFFELRRSLILIVAAVSSRLSRRTPLTYVRAGLPPTISIQGDTDPTVPYSQNVRLHQALDKAGIRNELVTIPGGKHDGFSDTEMTKAYAAIRSFLDKPNIVRQTAN